MMFPDACYELPFDVFQRYEPVARVLYQRPETETILDVGGAFGQFKRFLPRRRIIVLDLLAGDGQLDVQGDALQLPFREGSFDWVVSVDTVEHIPKAQRPTMFQEALRVARKGLIFHFPYDTEEAVLAERFIKELRKVHHLDAHFLQEHADCELPDINNIEDILKAQTVILHEKGTSDLPWWTGLMALCALAESHQNPSLLKAISRLSNTYIHPLESNGVNYRQLVFAGREERTIDELIKTYQQSAPTTPLFWQSDTIDMLLNLLDFNPLVPEDAQELRGKLEEQSRYLERVHDELKHLRQRNRMLEEHFSALNQLIMDMDKELQNAKQTVVNYETLQGEYNKLHDHTQTIQEHQKALETYQSKLEKEIAEKDKYLAELENKHREALSELERLRPDAEKYRQTVEYKLRQKYLSWKK